jgi:hypothetical protein
VYVKRALIEGVIVKGAFADGVFVEGVFADGVFVASVGPFVEVCIFGATRREESVDVGEVLGSKCNLARSDRLSVGVEGSASETMRRDQPVGSGKTSGSGAVLVLGGGVTPFA